MFVPFRGGGSALVVALSAGSVAGGLFLPLSLVYFTVLTDIRLPLLGLLVTLAGVVTVPLPVLAGWLVDRYGPRPVVVGAQALQAVAYLGLVVVRDPVGVFLASAAMAAGSRLFWSAVFALVADHADAHVRRPVESWFATVNVTRTVGIAGGGLLSGVVVSTGHASAYLGLAWAAAACAALSALALLAVDVPDRRPGLTGRPAAGYASLLGDHAFVRLLGINAVFALSVLSLGLMLPTLVRSGLHGPGWLTSVLLVGNAALVAVLGPRGGRVAARSSPFAVLRVAAVVWAVAFLALALGALGAPLGVTAPLLFGAVAVFSVAEVLHAPASASLVNAMAGPAVRGRYLAVFQYSFVAAELVGPVMFTGLFARGHPLPFLVLAGLNVLALPALTAVRRRCRTVPDGPATAQSTRGWSPERAG